MGLDRDWSAVLIGVGHLGRAILSYGGFTPQGFQILAAFDASPEKVGSVVDGYVVQHIGELEEFTRRERVHIGIVAVPAVACQAVVDQLVRCGVRAILNYAPAQAQVPKGIWVRDIDPVVALQSMTYYLKAVESMPALSPAMIMELSAEMAG
jgi:redox-sensing transcriptional repressor